MTTITHETAIMAVLDPTEPAKVNRLSRTASLIEELWPAEAAKSYNDLREPDLYDDNQAIWLSNSGVVAIEIDSLRGFNAYVRCRGMIRPGPWGRNQPWHIEQWGQTLTLWEFVKQVCC